MSLHVEIEKHFKGFSLRVAFQSVGGRTLGILGASGSGKSMTLRCIAGIEAPSAGRIAADERVLFDKKQRIDIKPQARGVGYLFQSYALFPNMTVAQNIACGIRGTKQEKGEKAAAIARQYGLEGLENRYPAQLSGGQQQRAALARILAYRPGTLLLDEPFSALDTHLKEALQVEMKTLLQSWQGNAVMVSHSRDEIYKLCDDLLVLSEGNALAFGDTKKMFAAPRLLEVARLTGCKNFSRARPVADNIVEALDWGCQLQVAGPLPPQLSHVGVRAHSFAPAQKGGTNAIATRAAGEVESPFEWNILFTNAEAAAPGETIWWKIPKGAQKASLPPYLGVRPEDVLLLS